MLKFVVFVYDLFKFFIMTTILIRLSETEQFRSQFFSPVFAYASPLVLFPFMSFFLWHDTQKNKSFAYLYTAGKVVGICAVTAAVLFNIKGFINPVIFLDFKTLLANLIFPLLAIIDIISVLPFISILKPNKQGKIDQNDSADSSSET